MITVIGLGYVGLPLAVELSKHFKIFGYDIDANRIKQLTKNFDRNKQVSQNELKNSSINFSSKLDCISRSSVVIIAVPTPILKNNKPNLSLLISATNKLSKILPLNCTVIYESTVYPGVTENICLPILKRNRSHKYLKTFWIGYSPERINPGDKINTLKNSTKLISGDSPRTINLMKKIYSKITNTYTVESIKIAEAAKITENIQRDVNIALINELSVIFSEINLSIYDVLEAAQTKWNFTPYQPGLVGGHCISVDPYYLISLAKTLNIQSDLICSAREVNSFYTDFISKEILKILVKCKTKDLIILGVSYKENIPDTRNSKIIDLYFSLRKKGIRIQIIDPIVNSEDFFNLESITLTNLNKARKSKLVFLAVPHKIFLKNNYFYIKKLMKKDAIIYDLKNVISSNHFKSKEVEVIKP